MRLGLIVRADKTGLGYQTKAFYDHLKPAKTMLIDISMLNGQPQYYGWYEDVFIVKGFPNAMQIKSFLQDLDCVFTCETPYNYELYQIARQMGVKTVNQYNPEFFDHFTHSYPKPDMLINPSKWLYNEVDVWCRDNGVKHKYIHFPVDRDKFKFRKRSTKKLMHIAGKPAANDRNGTWDFMRAVPNGIVTTQSEELARSVRQRYSHCNVWTNIPNPEDIYTYGDVMILPRKYGGNCLPLNEAISSGMPVIMPDISPNNQFLPNNWLVPAVKTGYFEPRIKVDIYQMDQDALAKKIEEIKLEWDIEKESEKADRLAETISWEALKSEYIKTFEELCES